VTKNTQKPVNLLVLISNEDDNKQDLRKEVIPSINAVVVQLQAFQKNT
jgi:hypothetical protein